jgi:hypothetical protein
METGKLNLQYPVYPDLEGLPNDKRVYACWYYYTLAQKLHEMLGDSTDDQFGILEGERWMDPQFEQIARSVALMYGFENPGEFMKNLGFGKASSASFRVGAPGSSTTNQGSH